MTVISLGAAAGKFRALGQQWEDAGKRGLYAAALRGVTTIKTQIIPSRVPQPVDRGTFRAGWDAERTPEGADVFNPEVHAVFIEEGVRAGNVKPGRAMLRALAEWAIRKGMARDPDEAAHIAWAIVGAMRKRGIFNRYGGQGGLGILRELVRAHLPKFVKEEVTRELKRVSL